MAQYNSSVKVSIRYYIEVALTKLVEVKIIVTSINHLINHRNGCNDGIVSSFEVNQVQKSTIKLVHLSKASNMIFDT